MIKQFLELCKYLGVPVLMDKTEWGSEFIIFMGVLLDGCHLTLGIPEDKRLKAIELLEDKIKNEIDSQRHAATMQIP